jgi:hypothetical protein
MAAGITAASGIVKQAQLPRGTPYLGLPDRI